MLENLKKNSVKFFVFTINILLTVIAVFSIREKDQARLLENVQKENIPNENVNGTALPSFENSIENSTIQTDAFSQPLPAESDAALPENSASEVSSPAPAITVPTVPAPAPVKTTAPANTKTKTS